jgi:FkbM family methyltransferase
MAKEVLIGGAYFGDHAILIAKQINGRGTVHCFEMNAGNAALLKANAEQNSLGNIRINIQGLWSKPGLGISLADGQDSHASSHIDMRSNTATETIDRYCGEMDISKLDLILLDIEGAEEEALKGAENFLKLPKDQAPILVYEIHRSYVDWSNGLRNTHLINWLADFGYESFALRDYQTNFSMAGKPIELVTLDDIYLEGPPHGFNMVAVKDRGVLKSPNIKFVSGVSPKLHFHRDPRWHSPGA